MNTNRIIKELLSAGLSPEEIYGLAQEHQEETKERHKFRQAVLDAIFNYIEYLIPDIEITKQDQDNMVKYLKEFEENLEIFVQKQSYPNKSGKKSPDEAIRNFLIKLGQ